MKRPLLLVLLLLASSCRAAPEPGRTVESPTPAAPATPEPAPPEAGPGGLIEAKPVQAPAGIKGWRVLYHSTTAGGADTTVSGLVFAPDSPAQSPRPVVAWAHGSAGLGDDCAPSRSPELLTAAGILRELIDKGFVVSATDYQGLGTPGPHPWLVGLSEGRNVLDSVRAAAAIPETGAGNRFVAFGASQGGGAALFAGELAPSYAPELELIGVVAEAPAAELDLLAYAPRTDIAGLGGFFVMGALGFKAAYPELPLEAVLRPDVIAQAEKIEQLCQLEIAREFRDVPLSEILVATPDIVDAWAKAIAENTPGNVKTPAPVLLVHGTDDRVVPPAVSQLLFQRLCGLGVKAQRITYARAGHIDVFAASADTVLKWIEDRTAGRPPVAGEALQSCL